MNAEESIILEGIERKFLIHILPQNATKKSVPLIIALHALGGNPKMMAFTTNLDEKADKEGFIVVYPEGTRSPVRGFTSWNAGFCCGYAAESQADDAGFIRNLIQYLTSNYPIDPNRIFITGISNGGMMAHRLGAEFSDQIAAIGVVSGAIGTMPSSTGFPNMIPEPQNPMPVMIFHGKKDRLVPYDGRKVEKVGTGRIRFLSVGDAVEFWRTRNECSCDREVEEISENVVKTSYEDCKNNGDVILYTIKDGGHSWPGGRVHLSGDEPSREISATDIIWDFFKKHPKKRR